MDKDENTTNKQSKNNALSKKKSIFKYIFYKIFQNLLIINLLQTTTKKYLILI